MNDPRLIVFAVGLAHLGALVYLWYFGLTRRFPWLVVHLAVEGLAQVAVLSIPEAWRVTFWAGGQIPRLFLRLLVVWEVSRESTQRGLDPRERRGLWFVAGAFVALCITASVGVMAITSAPLIETWYDAALFTRQYVLMGFAAWLVCVSAYLFWTRTQTDHNLCLYRTWATISAAMCFMSSAFVAGGLGYRLMPWTQATWIQVHDWRSWCAIFLVGIMLFIRPEPELDT